MHTNLKSIRNMHANLKSIRNMHANLKPTRNTKIHTQNNGMTFIYWINHFFYHQKVASNKFLAESY